MKEVVLLILGPSHLSDGATLPRDIGGLDKGNLDYLGGEPEGMNSGDLAGMAGSETDKEDAAERRDTDTYKEDGTQLEHHISVTYI